MITDTSTVKGVRRGSPSGPPKCETQIGPTRADFDIEGRLSPVGGESLIRAGFGCTPHLGTLTRVEK